MPLFSSFFPPGVQQVQRVKKKMFLPHSSSGHIWGFREVGHAMYLLPETALLVVLLPGTLHFLRPPLPLPNHPAAGSFLGQLQPSGRLCSRETRFSWIYFSFPQNYFWGESFPLEDILTLVESEIWTNSASNRFSWEASMQGSFSWRVFAECYSVSSSINLWRA